MLSTSLNTILGFEAIILPHAILSYLTDDLTPFSEANQFVKGMAHAKHIMGNKALGKIVFNLSASFISMRL